MTPSTRTNGLEKPGAPIPDLDGAVRELVRRVARSRPEVNRDGILVDQTIGRFRCVVLLVSGREPAPGETGELLRSLSPREQEIARMVAKGYTNKAMASVLEISSWTVSTHLRRMFGKLDVSSRAAMVARLYNSLSGVPAGNSRPGGDQLVELQRPRPVGVQAGRECGGRAELASAKVVCDRPGPGRQAD